MNEQYAEAIEILTGGSFDPHRIAIELAKQHPHLFVELHNSQPGSEDRKLYSAVRAKYIWSAKMGGPNVVEAIKLCRSMTGMGLKDAKDWVDKHRPKWDAEMGSTAKSLPPVSFTAPPKPYSDPEF